MTEGKYVEYDTVSYRPAFSVIGKGSLCDEETIQADHKRDAYRRGARGQRKAHTRAVDRECRGLFDRPKQYQHRTVFRQASRSLLSLQNLRPDERRVQYDLQCSR